MIEYHITTEGSCENLEELPEGAVIDAIGEIPCIGRCESCGIPLLEGDAHSSDEMGVLLCVSCTLECADEIDEEVQRVTHEMALDAGDPSLEGSPL